MTLLAALEAEDASCWAGMVESHLASLTGLVRAMEQRLVVEDDEALGRPVEGSMLAVFAGELAAASRPQVARGRLPDELIAAVERAIADAMVTVAGCLVGTLDAVAALLMLADGNPPF